MFSLSRLFGRGWRVAPGEGAFAVVSRAGLSITIRCAPYRVTKSSKLNRHHSRLAAVP